MSLSPSSMSSLVRGFIQRKRQEGPASEFRTLQPIASSIEVQNYKSALVLANKQLKAKPNHYIVVALKMIALAYASRPPTAAALKEITSSTEFLMKDRNGAGLGDNELLYLVSSVLAHLGRDDEVVALYNAATVAHPTRYDVQSEAFLHFIRSDALLQAQQLSMRMQKAFEGDEIMWWTLQLILLQAADKSNKTADLQLSIAERQVSTFYTAKFDKAQKDEGDKVAFGNSHEFHLLTRLLDLRAQTAKAKLTADRSATIPTSTVVLPSVPPRTADAPQLSPAQALLAHFDSEEGRKWCESGLGHEIWRRESELKFGSVQGGDWPKAWERLHASLEKGDTNWHTMLYLIRCVFAQAAGSSAAYDEVKVSKLPPPSEEGKQLLAKSRELFARLAGDAASGKERGFLLGLLEISRESRVRGWEEADSFAELVPKYFDQFGAKMCCFDDLHPYLSILSSAERAPLLEQMSTIAACLPDKTLKAAQRVINAAKIARFLAVDVNEASESAAAMAYTALYFDALPLGKALPATELQPADDFALLACQALVSAHAISHDRAYLEKAVVILEYALRKSKHKYQLRILLVNLLKLLGAPSLALAHYQTLGVKQIQYDTLAHLVLHRASTFAPSGLGGKKDDDGLWMEAATTEGWYAGGEREAREMRVRVFQNHNYTKIEDFSEFQSRLKRSLPKQLTKMETLRMRTVKGNFDDESTNAAFRNIAHILSAPDLDLVDNRDLATLPNLQPSEAAGIWDQTRLGPKTSAGWVRAFAVIYSHLFVDESEVVEVTPFENDELTTAEAGLLRFSQRVREALVAGLEETEPEQAVLAFFKEREAEFVAAVEDAVTLPWVTLHIAEIALEGYCLLDMAIDNRLDELAATKPADHVKHTKRLRTWRTSSREALRALGQKVTAHGKQVGKQRPKTMTSLSDLTQFEALNEDVLLNTAHALTDSRRQMAEGLGAAIHKRTIK